jgi:hypothetical protein
MIVTGKNQSIKIKTCLRATLSNTNPKWTGGLAWYCSLASAVKSQRVNTSDVAWPLKHC